MHCSAHSTLARGSSSSSSSSPRPCGHQIFAAPRHCPPCTHRSCRNGDTMSGHAAPVAARAQHMHTQTQSTDTNSRAHTHTHTHSHTHTHTHGRTCGLRSTKQTSRRFASQCQASAANAARTAAPRSRAPRPTQSPSAHARGHATRRGTTLAWTHAARGGTRGGDGSSSSACTRVRARTLSTEPDSK
jgi:hypothetical protein